MNLREMARQQMVKVRKKNDPNRWLVIQQQMIWKG